MCRGQIAIMLRATCLLLLCLRLGRGLPVARESAPAPPHLQPALPTPEAELEPKSRVSRSHDDRHELSPNLEKGETLKSSKLARASDERRLFVVKSPCEAGDASCDRGYVYEFDLLARPKRHPGNHMDLLPDLDWSDN